METMKTLIDEGYGMLSSYLAEISKQMAGPPYIGYFNCTDDFSEFDMEMGFPVAEELPVKDGIYMSNTYEGKVVTGTYKGSYSELEQAYGEISKYLEENKLESAGVYYDHYLNDPSDTVEDELLTKIVFVIK